MGVGDDPQYRQFGAVEVQPLLEERQHLPGQCGDGGHINTRVDGLLISQSSPNEHNVNSLVIASCEDLEEARRLSSLATKPTEPRAMRRGDRKGRPS
jgi:hypothetical protein